MAPSPKAFSNRNSTNSKKKSDRSVLETYYKKYVNLEFVKSLFIDPNRLPIVSVLIILAEFIINVLVINRVSYTEIDWKAYMQECEGFLNGTTNYALLKGDTGPLVYPAGFVYIYSALYFITSRGTNVRLAQYVFAGIYLLQMVLVLRLYTKSRKVPPFVLILSAFTSYRIHSIYVLRLFNDPIAILFVYMAINLFLDRNWSWGSVCFSLGVSVKMNILLFAPALLLFYITNLGYFKTVIQLAICGTIQLILGAPFLFNYPFEYIKGSFDLGRIFEHKWTVNYRFLDQMFFESKVFHIGLLLLHLGLLLLFAPTAFRYFQNYCRLRELQKQFEPQIKKQNIIVKNKKQKSKVAKEPKIPTETISEDQQKFLDSFEKSLQKSSGAAVNNQQTKPKTEKLTESNKIEKYSIHFDQSIQLALLPLFLCNFIGVACSRSLHYQFYIWYFHSLPYLTWCTDYGYGLRFLLMGLIEYCWNTYPSTNFSSVTLHLCHLVLLYGICRQIFKTKQMSEKVHIE